MRRICFKVLSPMQNPSEMGPMRGSKSLAFWDRGGGGGGAHFSGHGVGVGGGGGSQIAPTCTGKSYKRPAWIFFAGF